MAEEKGNIISPWKPTTNTLHLKVLGKALEEFGEVSSAVARCIIQGIDECEPVTGKPNKRWLAEELADAYAVMSKLVEAFGLDKDFIEERAYKKYDGFTYWHSME